MKPLNLFVNPVTGSRKVPANPPLVAVKVIFKLRGFRGVVTTTMLFDLIRMSSTTGPSRLPASIVKVVLTLVVITGAFDQHGVDTGLGRWIDRAKAGSISDVISIPSEIDRMNITGDRARVIVCGDVNRQIEGQSGQLGNRA